MVDDRDYLKLFNDINSNEITQIELEEIIEEELQKSEEDMDADLIEACIDRINIIKAQNLPNSQIGESKVKHIKPRLKKTVAAVAAVAVLFAATLTVSSTVCDYDLIDGIVQLYENLIVVRFDNRTQNSTEHKLLESKLSRELKKKGFSSVLLPQSVSSNEDKVYSVEYEYDKTDLTATANIYFLASGRKCSMHIVKYPNHNAVSAKAFPNQASRVEQVKLNNLSVYVIGVDEKSIIVYQDGLFGYTINLDLDFDEAITFAKTIK